MNDVLTLLSGAVAMSYVVAALFFLRFWSRSRDSLFLSFSAAFALFALNQALTGLYGGGMADTRPVFYSLRLLGFLLIIIAIVRKNMAR